MSGWLSGVDLEEKSEVEESDLPEDFDQPF